MATDKEPSIFDDRGTIGSSDELDEYGVWVKSEPQDLALASADSQDLDNDFSADISGDLSADLSDELPDSDDTDFSIPDFDALDPESPEASLSLDTPRDDLSEDSFDLPDIEADDEAEADSDVFNFGDLTEPPDFPSSEPDTAGLDTTETDSVELDTTELNTAELDSAETTIDIDAAELDSVVMDSAELDSLDIDSVETDSLELDNTIFDSGEPAPAEGASTETASQDNDDFTEIPMDDFIGAADQDELPDSPASLNLEDEPGEISIDFDTPEASVNAAPLQLAKQTDVKQSAAADLSTQLLMKIAEELSSIRNELSSLKKELSGIKPPAPSSEEEGIYGEEDDEKISLTGDELNIILNTADFTEEAGADAGIELSEEIELSDNSKLSGEVKLSNDIELSEEAESSDDIVLSEEVELSDDIELSERKDVQASPDSQDVEVSMGSQNILEDSSDGSTEETDLSLNIADLDMEIDLHDSNLEDLEGETMLGNSTALSDETPVDMDVSVDPVPDFAADETEELKEIRENGVEPITFAPSTEDANYLTDDPMAKNDFASGEFPEDLSIDLSDDSSDISGDISPESIDLSDAVIDEPDLSAEIHDNPLEEPSPEDVSITLDLSELDSTEVDSGELSSTELDSPEPCSANKDADEFASIELGSDELESIELESELDLVELGSEVDPIEMEPEVEEISIPLLDEVLESGADLSLIPEGFAGDELDSLEANTSEHVSMESGSDDLLSMPDVEELEAIGAEESLEDTIEELEELEADDSPTVVPAKAAPTASPGVKEVSEIPTHLKQELKTVLSYMDQLLEALPDEKIEEFARSEYYDTYKKLFKELGLA